MKTGKVEDSQMKIVRRVDCSNFGKEKPVMCKMCSLLLQICRVDSWGGCFGWPGSRRCVPDRGHEYCRDGVFAGLICLQGGYISDVCCLAPADSIIVLPRLDSVSSVVTSSGMYLLYPLS